MSPNIHNSKSNQSPVESVGLLHDCRDMVAEQLPLLLQQAMRTMDTYLADSADKAENEQQFQLYTSAIHELREKREVIEAEFQRRFIHGFNTSLRRSEAERDRFSGEATLIKQQAAEEELTVNRMVEHLNSGCRDELLALDTRMGLLLNDPDLKSRKNPMRPETICRALQDACGGIESGAEVKVLLLKLFNRFINPAVKELYRNLNGHLSALEASPAERLPACSSDPQAPAAEKAIPPMTIRDDKDDKPLSLQQLMTMVEARIEGPLKQGTQGAGGRLLVDALTKIQKGNLAALQESAESARAKPVNVLHAINTSKLGSQLAKTDRLTLVIIAVMFDYILNDRSIPADLRFLLGRLQIPLFKAALLDEELFGSRAHPARRLLDLLAQLAFGWSPTVEAKARVEAHFQQLIHRILSEFSDDLQLFAVLAEETEQFNITLEQQARAERMKTVMSIKTHEQAIAAAERKIDQQLEGAAAPAFVGEFLRYQWKQALVAAYLAGGEEGEAWQRNTETLDDLIWSAEIKAEPAQKKRLSELLPGLIKNLKLGMAQAQMPAEDQAAFLADLAKVHKAAMDAHEEPLNPVEWAAHLDSLITQDGKQEAAQEFFLDRMDQLFGVGSESGSEDDELALLNEIALKVEESEADESPEPMDPLEKLVRSFESGNWLEFRRGKKPVQRCELLWKREDCSKYVFVDQAGFKMSERTCEELVEEFRQRSAFLINKPEEPLFDRAVEYVVECCAR